MIPFVEFQPFSLGPLTIHMFGILLGIGVMLGMTLCRNYAERVGIDDDIFRWLGFRIFVIGFIGCHVFDVLFYQFDAFKEDPLLLFKVWSGIASWGGILFGGLALFYYVGKMKLPAMKLADTVLYGFIPGFMFGRMGCSIAHDHKGIASEFALAVGFPSGPCASAEGAWIGFFDKLCIVNGNAPAHDLGLYDLVLCFVLWIFVLIAARFKNRPPGTFVVIAAFTYAPVRFFFEYLRPESTDPRYAGFTPAQWLCVLSVIAGARLLFKLLKGKTRHEEDMIGTGEGAFADKIRTMMRKKAPAPKSS